MSNTDFSVIFKNTTFRGGKLSRRMMRKLNCRCRYCSGFEEKILKKDSSEYSTEISEMEKHEIILEIAGYLGNEPDNISLAEKIFDNLKYSIAEFVLKHEFNEESNLSVQLALWVENRKKPELYKPLQDVIDRYLKPLSPL